LKNEDVEKAQKALYDVREAIKDALFLLGFRVGLSAILSKGKLEESDAIAIMLVQSQKDLSTERSKQFLEILNKHPEQYEKLKKQIEQLTKFLDKMEKLI